MAKSSVHQNSKIIASKKGKISIKKPSKGKPLLFEEYLEEKHPFISWNRNRKIGVKYFERILRKRREMHKH